MARANSISSKAAPQAAPASAPSNGARPVISNVVTLDAKTPIPLEYNGTWYTTRKGGRYIPFLNPLDNFPRTLLEARMISTTANLCISTKVQYCIGGGWYLRDGVTDDSFTDWAKCLNREGHDLNKVLSKIFDGLFHMGNCFVKVVRTTIGSSKYIKVIPLNMQDCRLLTNDDDDMPIAVAVTKDFRQEGVTSLRKDKYDEIPLYTPDKQFRQWVKDSNGDECIVLHLKNEVSGYDYYGMPSNVSALPYQVLEYKAARYNLDSFDNNMVIGGVLLLQSGLTQEEADKLGKKIVQQHTGDGKRGRVMILAGESAGEHSKYLPFEKQEDGDYIEGDKRYEEKIIAANEWDPLLMGIRRESGLGNGGNSYIRAIFDIKNETVIKPAQRKILGEAVTPILEICDEWMGTQWSKLPIGIRTSPPVSFAGDIDVNSVVTKNEGREILGLEALPDQTKGDEFITQAPKAKPSSVKEDAANV